MRESGLEEEDYILEPSESEKALTFSFPAENSTINLKRLYVGNTAVNAELGIGLS